MKKIFRMVILMGCIWIAQSLPVQATTSTDGGTTETTTTAEVATEETTTEEATTEETTKKKKKVKIPKKGYFILKDEGHLQCYYKGVKQKKVYVALVKSEGKYKVVKPTKENSVIYYFNKRGNGVKHTKKQFVKVSYGKTKNTYFSNRGKIEKNKIVGNEKQGYYYVDGTGVKTTKREIRLAVKFVRDHTKSGWSQSKKLRACYDYLWQNYTYQRFYDGASASAMPSYARYMFTYKRGNCYRYAATFAYIAKVLGYEVRVVNGSISSLRGGMTPHGWTEIKIDGVWYMFDANMQRNYPKISSYQKTATTYPYKHGVSKKYNMKVKKGEVIWK